METVEKACELSRLLSKREDVSINVDEESQLKKGDALTNMLVGSMRENLTSCETFWNDLVSIYEVPKKFRENDEDKYSPRLISIGPIHHGKPHLQIMQSFRWLSLKRFQSRYKVGLHEIVELAIELEDPFRGCYQYSFDTLQKEEFIEMIYLDTIFILELFTYGLGRDHSIPLSLSMQHDLLHDMLLLENQLPFFTPLSFLDSVRSADVQPVPEFYLTPFIIENILKYFSDVGNLSYGTHRDKNYDSWPHLIQFLRDCYGPSDPDEIKECRREGELCTRSASDLQEAGVKFQRKIGKSLLDVDFSDGVMRIPTLTLNEWTETLFRNMIAYEQCHPRLHHKDITSYVVFMDSLINSHHDVDILVKYRIIENRLSDNQQVVDLFKNISKGKAAIAYQFYFRKYCEDLNAYSKNDVKAILFRWKGILKRDYCGHMRGVISVVALIVVFVLTVTQTVSVVLSF